MTIENLFARKRALHRPAGNHRQFRDDHFMIKRIALAAKAATIWRRDHANVTGREPEDLRQRAMNVMRRLG